MIFKVGDRVILKQSKEKGKIETISPCNQRGYVIVRIDGQSDGYMFPNSEIILDKEILK